MVEGGILGKLWTLCTCYRKVISYANLCLSLTQTSLFQLLPHNKLISACLVEGTRALWRDRKVLHFINLILNALTVHTYIRRMLSLILFPPVSVIIWRREHIFYSFVFHSVCFLACGSGFKGDDSFDSYTCQSKAGPDNLLS